MAEQFRQWLAEEMSKRRYSHGGLARDIGISQPFVTRVLSGEKSPSVDFCIKVAAIFNEPEEKVFRMAGLLSPLPTSDDDTLQELLELARNLPPEDRQELLDYARFKHRKRKS